MNKKLDIVLINPGDKKQIYQSLSNEYVAIEPPFWLAVIAAYLRNNKYKVAVIDANAQSLSPEEVAEKVKKLNPLLVSVIVYGSQPSASTQNMTIAGKICSALKKNTKAKVAIGGLHPSALPLKTIQKESVDFVIDGEGPITLSLLVDSIKREKNDFDSVPGLWYRKNGDIKNNLRPELIKNLDKILPIAAWDLLPMDKYRAHNWHCFDDIKNRKPYAAIYTSLGCPYNCIFCCINALFGKPGIRYRSPGLVVREMELLAKEYKLKNIKIVDELFVLDEKHYMGIVELLIKKKLNLNIWAYARVDTVKSENLKKMKKAGINWLALGIESANSSVRDDASKQMKISDIKKVVKDIQDAEIRVIGNFIFGLPGDTLETMQETLDMAIELNCEFVNFYCGMAYPGSKLYTIAQEENWQLPKEWHGFSQHSYETLPLPTKCISAKEVLRFRDNAFHEYFENPYYLESIKQKFGEYVQKYVKNLTKTRLKRGILE